MKTTHLFSAVLVAATTYAHTSEQWGIFAKVGDRFKPLVIPDLGVSDFEYFKYSDSNQKPTSFSLQEGIAKRPGGYVGIVGDYLAYGPDLSPKPFSLGPDNKIVKLDFHRCPNSGDAIVVKMIPDCIPVDLYLNKLESTTNDTPDNGLASPSTVRYVPAPDVPHTLFVKEREYFRLLYVSLEGALVWGASTLRPVRMHYQNDNLFTEAADGTRSFVFIDKGTLGLSDLGPRPGVSIDVHGKISNVDGKIWNVQLYSCPSAYPLYTISVEDGNGCFPSEVYYLPYDKSGNPTLPGNALPEAEVYEPDVEENPMAFFAKEKDSYHPLSSYKGSGRSVQLSYGLPLPPIEIEWQGSYARPRNTLISGFAGFLDNQLVFSSFKDDQFTRSLFENGQVLKVFSCNFDTSGIFYILRESDPSLRCVQVELCVGRFDRRTGKYISFGGAPGQDDDDSEQEGVKPAKEGKSEGANAEKEEKPSEATPKHTETSNPENPNRVPELDSHLNPGEGDLGHSDVERDTPKGESSGGQQEVGKVPMVIEKGEPKRKDNDKEGSNSGGMTNPKDSEIPAPPMVDVAQPEKMPISPKIDDKEPNAGGQNSKDRKMTKELDQKPDDEIQGSIDTAWRGGPESVGEANGQTDAEETEETDSSERPEEKDHKHEESERDGPTKEEKTRDPQPDKGQGAADGGEPETKHRPVEQKPTDADHPKKGPISNDGNQMESEPDSVNDTKGHGSAKGEGPGEKDTKEKDPQAKGKERSREGNSKDSEKESSNAEGSKNKDPNDEGTNEEGAMVEGLNEQDSNEETNGKDLRDEDSSEDSSKDSSKDSNEDSSKDSSKDSSEDSSKDSSKDSSEDSKEDWNENSNADWKETGQDAKDSTEQNSKKVSYKESKTKNLDAEESKENSMGDYLDAEAPRAIDSKNASKKDSKRDPNEKVLTEEGSMEKQPNKASNESNNDPKEEEAIGEDMKESSNGLDSNDEVSEANNKDPKDPHRNAPGEEEGREAKPFEKGRDRNATLAPSHIFPDSMSDPGSIFITSRYNSTNHSIPEASRTSEQARHFFSHTNMSSLLELNKILVFGTSATSFHKASEPKLSSSDAEIVSGSFAKCQAILSAKTEVINSSKTENTTPKCTPKAITLASSGAECKPGERLRRTPHTDHIRYCTQPSSTVIHKCDKSCPPSTVIVTTPSTRYLSGVRQVLETDILPETPSRHETANKAPQGATENGEAKVSINGSTSGISDTSECWQNDEPLKGDKPGEGLSRPGDSNNSNDHPGIPSNETEKPSAETDRTSNVFDEQKAELNVERNGSIEQKNGSKGPSNESGKQRHRPDIAIENSERHGVGSNENSSNKKVIGDNENDITKQSEYPAGPKPATDPASRQALSPPPIPSNRENPFLSTPFSSVSELEVTPLVNGAFRNTYCVWILGLVVMFV